MKKSYQRVFVCFFCLLFFLTGCAGWKRTQKSFSSSFNNGLERELIIKTQNGEVIYEDTGKFDIEVSEQRVKYIDEEDKLHIIYLGGSTAIVNEK